MENINGKDIVPTIWFKGYLNEVGGKLDRISWDSVRFKRYLNEVGGKYLFPLVLTIIISLF